MSPRLSLLAFLVGCGPCPTLGSATVEGGTPDQRDVVRAAAGAFARWAGDDRTCVAALRLQDDLGGDGLTSLGRYRSGHRDVLLLADQDDLFTTTVHELCHTVDHREGLSSDHEDAFRYDPGAFDYDARTAESRVREAYALTCEAGPDLLALTREIATTCGSTADLRGLNVVLTQVWDQAGPAVDGSGLETQATVTWTPPTGVRVASPLSTAATLDGKLLVRVLEGDRELVAILDGTTGEVVSGALPPRASPELAFTVPTAWDALRVVSGPDGTLLGAFTHTLPNGDTVSGVAALRDDTWRAVPSPCASPDARWVTLDDHPWLVDADGTGLRWTRWTAAR